jgi:hypothetical protein
MKMNELPPTLRTPGAKETKKRTFKKRKYGSDSDNLVLENELKQ